MQEAKQIIQSKFSAASGKYEEFFSLQKDIGLKLLDRINAAGGVTDVLDIGMGTGWLTKRFKQEYPHSEIFGVDFAFGMLEAAQRNIADIRIAQADALTLPFKPKSFDIILSNLTYQWVEDLQKAFNEVNNALKQKGVFYFSCFGKKTLKELFDSLNRCSSNTFSNDILSEKEAIENALKSSNFNDIKINTEVLTMDFTDIFDIVRWLKNTGANGLRHDIFVGRDLLMKAGDFYKKNFSNNGNIYASFELILGEARK